MSNDAPEYADWTLEELQEASWNIEAEIRRLKEEQRVLLPFLEAAHRAKNEEDAAKADPGLTQGVGI